MRWTSGALILSLAMLASAFAGPEGPVVGTATAAAGYEIVEMVRGAPLHGANGAFVGPDGHLYVASSFGREIVVLDVDSGAVLRRYGPEAGVLGPDDVIVGPDGSMYWTDIDVGEVGRRAPDGTVTKQFVAQGVNPITLSPDGRLFVALCFYGDGLYELDPELIEPPRPIVVASEEHPFPLGFLNGFDVGPDGRLYGPLLAAGMVVGIDVDSCEATSQPWSDCDIRVVATDMLLPGAVKFDPAGVLHALDQVAGAVYRVDLDSGERPLVAELGEGLDNLAFDATGRLFVTNAADGSVVEVLDGGVVRTLSRGGLIGPAGVAVLERPDGGASLFVGDIFRLWEYDAATGEALGFAMGHLIGEGLPAPNGLSSDGDRLVVASTLAAAVQVYDPWAAEALEQHAFGYANHAVRLGGDLAVIDLLAGGVVWASSRALILAIDEQSVWLPAALATDGERLWVSDWATGIVWQLGFEDGAALPAVAVAFDLANPEGLALDGAGGLLVVEVGAQRLSRVDLASGAVEAIASGLEVGLPSMGSLPPTNTISGVAVDAAGAIYVTGDLGNVVYRIARR